MQNIVKAGLCHVPEGRHVFTDMSVLENMEMGAFLRHDNREIESLFKMTPYYYKTSRTDQQKLEKLNSLTTEIEFCVLVYKKL